ncbi:MAG: hypothetical protein IQL11_03000 [Bacteroidales bacterium]|nr:hypothetical protein [Bacteroidales bacterium]
MNIKNPKEQEEILDKEILRLLDESRTVKTRTYTTSELTKDLNPKGCAGFFYFFPILVGRSSILNLFIEVTPDGVIKHNMQ